MTITTLARAELIVQNDTKIATLNVGVEDSQGAYCYFSGDIISGKTNQPHFEPQGSFCNQLVTIKVWAKSPGKIYDKICELRSSVQFNTIIYVKDNDMKDNNKAAYVCAIEGATFNK